MTSTVASGTTAAELAQLPSRRGGRRRRLVQTVLRQVVVPLLLLVVVVVLWQSLVINHLFNLKTYTVPQPSTILQTLHDDWSSIWADQKQTLEEAVKGYLLGGIIGMFIAVVVVGIGRGGPALMSFAGLINAIPIVAIAPVAILYFGYGAGSKIAVVALLCGAIVLLNALKGLTSVPPDPLLLMRSYAAPPWQVILKLRLPTSLPFVFTALKYNVTIALVAAIISEFFGGYGGVGIEMEQSLVQFAMPTAWAAMLLVGAIGVVWFELTIGLEYLCTRRHAAARAQAIS